jgi:hypothetical protein
LPDKWTGMSIGVTCGTIDYGIFQGTLTPGSGDGDAQGSETVKSPDEPDSYVAFRGDAGELTAPNGSDLSISGFYHFGTLRPPDEVVTGEL